MRQVYDFHPDVVVIDIDLPYRALNALAVCERIREVSLLPIIMLGNEAYPTEIITSLEMGIDNFLSRSVRPEVLKAFINAKLRRAAQPSLFQQQIYEYSDEWLTIDLENHRVVRGDEPVKISPVEFRLLSQLVQQMPRVIPYEQLLGSVWGEEYVTATDYLRVYIWHLRQKLEKNPKKPVYLINEMGLGYRFENKGSK